MHFVNVSAWYPAVRPWQKKYIVEMTSFKRFSKFCISKLSVNTNNVYACDEVDYYNIMVYLFLSISCIYYYRYRVFIIKIMYLSKISCIYCQNHIIIIIMYLLSKSYTYQYHVLIIINIMYLLLSLSCIHYYYHYHVFIILYIMY